MEKMKWKLFYWRHKRALYTSVIVCCGVACTLWLCLVAWTCTIPLYDSTRPNYICTVYAGRYGNLMFQYAFHYAFARERNLQMLFPLDNDLLNVFNLPLYPNEVNYGTKICSCFTIEEDEVDCALDSKIVNLPGEKDYNLKGYFQSWKYWKKYESDLRKHFQIREDVKKEAKLQLERILQENKKSSDITLVGIHVRRGDMASEDLFVKFGYRLATREYLLNAIEYFRKQFKNVLFIASSNSPIWTQEAFRNIENVHVLVGNSPELDLAILTQTQHTISTVGSFGWWVAWLTNGTTIYYKYPFVEGSSLAKQFGGRFTEDFIYPGWIGME